MTDYSLLNATQTAILLSNQAGQIIWANSASEQLFAHSMAYLQQLNVNQLLQPTEMELTEKTAQLSTVYTHTAHLTHPVVTHDQWIAGVQQPLFVDYCISPIEHQPDAVSNPKKEEQATNKQAINKQAVNKQKTDSSEPKITTVENNLDTTSSQTSNSGTTSSGTTSLLIEIWSKDRHHRISQEQYTQQQYALARNMLRSVAHEVKNPLAGIRGAGQLLQKLTQQSTNQIETTDNTAHATHTKTTNKTTVAKLKTYTDLIISETDRLNNLINQLLGIKQAPTKHKLNLHQPLEHVLTLNTSELADVHIVRDYDISIPEVIADNEQMIQVFLNLINNAIEAIKRKQQTLYSANPSLASDATIQTTNIQKVQEETYQPYQPCLTLQTRVEFSRTIDKIMHKKVAKVSIIDNGIGIDKEFIKQIFFPLVTSRAEGTGLGLALVHDIIQQHQGQIEVFSEAGSTCFSLYLPFD